MPFFRISFIFEKEYVGQWFKYIFIYEYICCECIYIYIHVHTPGFVLPQLKI